MTTKTASPFKRNVIRLLKVILVGVILYFLGRQVVKHWASISGYDWQIRPLILVMSVVVGLVTFWLLSTIWRILIAGFGHEVPHDKAFRVFYLSNLGRYIPGKIWQFFGAIYLTRQQGIPPEHAAASMVLVQLFAIPASFLVFVLGSQLEPLVLVEQIGILGDKSAWLMTLGMLGACAAIVLRPDKVLALGNYVLRKLGRGPIRFHLDKTVALMILVGYCLAWIGYGLAFWLFLQAVMVDPRVSPVAAIAAFNAAYQIGYLVLFAPAGFGPRELALGALLTPFVGAALAPGLAILARLWAILVEATAALIALMIRR